MFGFNSRSLINPQISFYIKDQTNKSMKKYLNNKQINQKISVTDLVNVPKCCYILPFVSLISFLAGYNLCNLINTQLKNNT